MHLAVVCLCACRKIEYSGFASHAFSPCCWDWDQAVESAVEAHGSCPHGSCLMPGLVMQGRGIEESWNRGVSGIMS